MSNDEPNLASLLARAVTDEAKFALKRGLPILKKGLTLLLERLDPSPAPVPPPSITTVPRTIRVEPVGEPHKSVREAIAETDNHIKDIRAETRDRRKWMYLKLSDAPPSMSTGGPPAAMDQFDASESISTIEKAVEFFGQPPGTLAVEGRNFHGQRMVAVWDAVKHGPTPTVEPVFE